jgi:hypothetical protein
VDLLVEFVAGDFGDGAGETDRPGGFAELAAQLASHDIELCGGEVLWMMNGMMEGDGFGRCDRFLDSELMDEGY